ncbi:metallophosphoesterase [Bacteriovorax sp. Seq25_V]|uniref:metallophosphoesterase n=1 Tax=Bacteriovorax sp. Seq25_V TaxID=1201288 RepID=UPI000389FA1E|nr:metallophosphoesterase [Bacteriovorax sp. Seq25_V]EQC43918.1 calcineurin-like phosphoesterase family protein [Bacteriovorax sp. Seq25_V]
MKFLRKDKIEKTILVISDIHLGAGEYVDGQKNYLEDFHSDEELIDFLEYFCEGKYASREIELIINGDFFDLLAVPFVEFYDDEFWSEKASLKKLEMILEAHEDVMEALAKFIEKKNRKITMIVGNHDAELVFESLQKMVLSKIPDDRVERFTILLNEHIEYRPHEKVCVKHGHEYELAHHFNSEDNIIEDSDGEKYFNPPWGSYYVTRVINKFKEERYHVNAVRPINKFLINGLIYDTFFTARFILANMFYFVMVRTIFLFKSSKNLTDLLNHCLKELELFKDYESLTYDFLSKSNDTQVLIVGHTHEPICRNYANGKTFINTGTWTRMYHLDFGKDSSSVQLTFAKIDVVKNKEGSYLRSNLNSWQGTSKLPYHNFN